MIPRFAFIVADFDSQVVSVFFVGGIRMGQNGFSLLFSQIQNGSLTNWVWQLLFKILLIPGFPSIRGIGQYALPNIPFLISGTQDHFALCEFGSIGFIGTSKIKEFRNSKAFSIVVGVEAMSLVV